MFALTMSTVEPKNIKEAMADSSMDRSNEQDNFHSLKDSQSMKSFAPLLALEDCHDLVRICCTQVFSNLPDGLKNGISLMVPIKGGVYVSQPDGFIDPDQSNKTDILRSWYIQQWDSGYPKESGFDLYSFSDPIMPAALKLAKAPSGGIQFLRYKRRCCSLIPAESDSLPHAHAQITKTYYKHQDSRIKKAHVLKTKTSAYSDIKDNSSETKPQGSLLESFQEDTKYEHVGQDTRSQGGKDDQD
ncbi:hypothetical protein Tco_1202227 [Tanacetum coccineum]